MILFIFGDNYVFFDKIPAVSTHGFAIIIFKKENRRDPPLYIWGKVLECLQQTAYLFQSLLQHRQIRLVNNFVVGEKHDDTFSFMKISQATLENELVDK